MDFNNLNSEAKRQASIKLVRVLAYVEQVKSKMEKRCKPGRLEEDCDDKIHKEGQSTEAGSRTNQHTQAFKVKQEVSNTRNIPTG